MQSNETSYSHFYINEEGVCRMVLYCHECRDVCVVKVSQFVDTPLKTYLELKEKLPEAEDELDIANAVLSSIPGKYDFNQSTIEKAVLQEMDHYGNREFLYPQYMINLAEIITKSFQCANDHILSLPRACRDGIHVPTCINVYSWDVISSSDMLFDNVNNGTKATDLVSTCCISKKFVSNPIHSHISTYKNNTVIALNDLFVHKSFCKHCKVNFVENDPDYFCRQATNKIKCIIDRYTA